MKCKFWQYIKIDLGCQRREEIMEEAGLMVEEVGLASALTANDVSERQENNDNILG